MKLLVFAHTPPPHHGQSFMVQLLLEALGGDVRRRPPGAPPPPVQCYHVNSRVSSDAEDIGKARGGKVWLIFKHCLHALWCRLRHGVTDFYCIPAFPARAPLYRDWIVLTLCRLFFKRVIFHWHAVGLGEWLDAEAKPWERWVSQRAYHKPDLSLIVRPFNTADPGYFASQRVEVVLNGIPDPCPGFEAEVLPRRLARAAARKKLEAGQTLTAAERQAAGGDPEVYRVLFLSLCHRGKGLFDTLDGVALARPKLAATRFQLRLTVAGDFWREEEEREFEERLRRPDLCGPDGSWVDYAGFVSGPRKEQLLRDSDCMCFPTCMPESFGLVLVEAMAYGLPIITTRWRGLPELLPAGYDGVVEPRAPDQIAAKLADYVARDYTPGLRQWFLSRYTDAKFGERIRSVLASFQAMVE